MPGSRSCDTLCRAKVGEALGGEEVEERCQNNETPLVVTSVPKLKFGLASKYKIRHTNKFNIRYINEFNIRYTNKFNFRYTNECNIRCTNK